MKQIPLLTWPLTNKRVFVRADLNTELTAPDFPQSLKFQRLLPTLEYIKKARARIVLATHIGRPHGFDAQFSTRQLTHYFNQAGFSCVYSTPENLPAMLDYNHDIILLENLRFYPEEEAQSNLFAQKITYKCDYFVEDGFGVLMRNETSITTAAQLFKPEKRSMGLLVAEELTHLRPLKKNPEKPFLVMVGGGKGEEKLKTLYHFLDKATHIALLPGLSELPEVQDFIHEAQKHGTIILMPEDYVIIDDQKISIGPKTLKNWQPLILSMQTIVYNGLMGFVDKPDTTVMTHKLFELFAQSTATVIIAGGDTTLAAQQWHITSDRIFLSTGGGATLSYLSGQKLPGLKIVTSN
jgi:3-phosphoglycerate kinase